MIICTQKQKTNILGVNPQAFYFMEYLGLSFFLNYCTIL